jgi:hypothetical protein
MTTAGLPKCLQIISRYPAGSKKTLRFLVKFIKIIPKLPER